ncbi:Type IV Pilus-assembly protein W [Modicisalibacter muralis]|uniref:Type IV Pilus-assembly protein W n=1 Tax=Modicisalibacter muralis TaxID=119000 RepID=A0A1G9QKW2_9GAMM|nr:PilW family protein [Halomonas muralis]SDM11663.1 Type IV Pilus-assembly protein W [Halomonas muralis]
MKRSCSVRMGSQLGISLVELMISMVIGLVVVGLVTGYYLSSRQTYGNVNASSGVNDHGRFAISMIEQQLWLAGYADDWQARTLIFPSRVAAGGMPGFAAGEVVKATAQGELWIRYRAASLEEQPLRDCSGQALDDPDVVVIAHIDTVNNTLQCTLHYSDAAGGTTSDGAVTLIAGVDALRWAFLDGSNSYKRYADGVDWPSVRAVRVDLVLSSMEPAFATSQAQVIRIDEQELTYNDDRMRRHISRVVALRNLLGGL